MMFSVTLRTELEALTESVDTLEKLPPDAHHNVRDEPEYKVFLLVGQEHKTIVELTVYRKGKIVEAELNQSKSLFDRALNATSCFSTEYPLIIGWRNVIGDQSLLKEYCLTPV